MTPSPWVWMPTRLSNSASRRLELAADVEAEGGVPVVADAGGHVGLGLAVVGREGDQATPRTR